MTNDIIDNWEASQPLIEAVRARKVALIGSFAGHLVHDKQIFQVLFKPETKALLTDEENAFVEATVPFTAFLNDDEVDLDAVKRDREGWIIKPVDAYGSKDVYAGLDFSDEEWAQIIDRYADSAAGAPFIVQHYCTPHRTMALPLRGEEGDYTAEPQPYTNLSGPVPVNGRFTGVFSRLGPEPVISKKTGGILLRLFGWMRWLVKVISQYRFVTSRTAFWNAGRSSAFLHRLASNEETELRICSIRMGMDAILKAA